MRLFFALALALVFTPAQADDAPPQHSKQATDDYLTRQQMSDPDGIDAEKRMQSFAKRLDGSITKMKLRQPKSPSEPPVPDHVK